MENQNNPKYPKYLVSLSNTLIKLYSSVKGPEVFHDLLPKESQSSKSLEVDPYLLLSKVNVLTSHLSQVKVPENGLTQSLACSDSTDYEKDENRTVKIESNFRDTDSYRSGLTMKDQIDMIGAKARKFEEESNDCNKSSVESDQDQIQIKIPNSPKKMKKSSIKKNVQPSQRNYWDQDEDQTLLNLVETYGEKWTKIANILGGRTGKQVRDRYINYLRPTIKRREWTLEEETKLHELYSKFGNKWSTIAMYLNGRTENQVKNRFYAAIRKQKRPAADNHTYANDEEPELAKFVKMEPSVAKKNDFNTKTELFTKSEDPDGLMKHEYLDFSNSINSIKFEPKEEYEKMSQIQEQRLPNLLFNAINENQKRLFMQSGFQQKKYSLLKLGATGRGGFTNNNTEESIELPSEYSNKFLLN